MRTSQTGIDMIKGFEGLRLFPYKPLMTEKYYTIGYGHYGADVTPDMSITIEEAEEILKTDLIEYENAVGSLKIAKNQCQFDALVSFAYNCGVGNLKKLCTGRTPRQIADAMLLYTKAGGREIPGLVRRRTMERALFLSDKAVIDIALEVIDGKWGNGAERRGRLTDAGYSYELVQREVNKILEGRK